MRLLGPPCLAWIVLSQLYRDGLIARLLRGRLVQFFGLISYSLYLWQQLFTASAEQYRPIGWLGAPVLMLVAAVLSYYLVERPCLRGGRRLLTRRLPAPNRHSRDEIAAGWPK